MANAPALRVDPIDALNVREVWRYFVRQPLAYWLICLYLFFEYVRPQQIYQPLDGFPYTQTILILTCIAWVVQGMPLRRWLVTDTFLVLYSALVIFTSYASYYPAEAREQWIFFFPWVLIYFLITTLVSTRGRILIFVGTFLLWSLKMSQHATRSWFLDGFRFRPWGTTGAPGWFQNSGEFAIQMVIFLPLSICFVLALRPYLKTWKKALLWIVPVTAIIGIMSSSSRGGQLAAVGAVIVLLLNSRFRAKAIVGVALAAFIALRFLPPEQIERFSNMGDDRTSELRLILWEDGREILSQHPVFGIGYGNWLPYYLTRYNPEGQVVHNIFLEAGAEMGYAGLATFIFGILSLFLINWKTRRFARRLGPEGKLFFFLSIGLDAGLVGFLIGGFFVTILYYPFFWIQLALAASLHVSALKTGRRVGVASSGRRRPVYAKPALNGPVTPSPVLVQPDASTT